LPDIRDTPLFSLWLPAIADATMLLPYAIFSHIAATYFHAATTTPAILPIIFIIICHFTPLYLLPPLCRFASYAAAARHYAAYAAISAAYIAPLPRAPYAIASSYAAACCQRYQFAMIFSPALRYASCILLASCWRAAAAAALATRQRQLCCRATF